MQQNYTSRTSLTSKLLVGGLVLITSLIGILNNGCVSGKRTLKMWEKAAKNDWTKIWLCGNYLGEEYTDSNPENQEFRDCACKEGITNLGETIKTDFRKQGREMVKKTYAPLTKISYDNQFVYLSKQGFPERYAVQLDTLTAYEHVKDDKWRPNVFMTRWVREGEEFNKTLNQISTQANKNDNQTDRNGSVMNDIIGRVGGNIATQGLLKAAADFAKP